MKLNELIKEFTIAMSNEEKDVLESIQVSYSLVHLTNENSSTENLVRKSLVSKVKQNGYTMVVANEFPKLAKDRKIL